MPTEVTFWGALASPFQLKMQAIADACRIQWRRLPAQANPAEAWATLLRLRLDMRLGRIRRFSGFTAGLDEYPTVPYYRIDGGPFHYDSSDFAAHLASIDPRGATLLPEDPATSFLVRLIDEAFDEWGLYMVHHNRWVTSARTNRMAADFVAEIGSLVPSFLRETMRKRVAARQTRRCAYLFSVAPQSYGKDLPRALRAPAREGFPPTHELLDTSWREYLAAMEALLARQPYLLGDRFTLADASAYGQLAMNLPDGRAADLLQELAPRTYAWLTHIDDGEHHRAPGSLEMTEALVPLLDCIKRTFIPLMRQNAGAFRPDAPRTNEAAFDAGEQLYDGELLGHPFRAVCKTFQVRVWQDLCSRWAQLDDESRRRLAALGVDGDGFTTARRQQRST